MTYNPWILSQPPPVEVKETPAPKESRSRSASGGFEETKTRVAVVAAEEEPPLSPASSIGSTELDHSIGLGRGKGGPKPGSTGGMFGVKTSMLWILSYSHVWTMKNLQKIDIIKHHTFLEKNKSLEKIRWWL